MIELIITKTPLSWNKFYSGMNWRSRMKIIEEWKILAKQELKKHNIDKTQIKLPLLVLMIPQGRKPLDSDNHGSAKPIIDAIKEELGIDDTTNEILFSPSIPKKAKKGSVVVKIYDQDEVDEFLTELRKELQIK